MFYLIITLIIANFLSWVFWQINLPQHISRRNYSLVKQRREKADFRVAIFKPLTWLLLAANFGLIVYSIVGMFINE